MIEAKPLALDGVYEITPRQLGDDRGFFSETYNCEALKEIGISVAFVQDNHSLSVEAGVLRGLHFQRPPAAQDKLVRVISGRVYDVIVDIRQGSKTFGQWIGIEISAKKWNQVFIPKGFAHGFLTLEPNTQFLYKVSDYYSRDCDRSIRFDDPDIGIEWPGDKSTFTLSEKDRMADRLRDIETGFRHEG